MSQYIMPVDRQFPSEKKSRNPDTYRAGTTGSNRGTFENRITMMYEQHRKHQEKLAEQRAEIQAKETEGCTFQPTFQAIPRRREVCSSRPPIIAKTLEEKEFEKCTFKPKLYKPLRTQEAWVNGYDSYVSRFRKAAEEKEQKKIQEEQLTTGAKYDQICRHNFQPLAQNKNYSRFPKPVIQLEVETAGNKRAFITIKEGDDISALFNNPTHSYF